MALHQNWYDQFLLPAGSSAGCGTTATLRVHKTLNEVPVRAKFRRWNTALAVALEADSVRRPSISRTNDGRWEVLYWTRAFLMNGGA